MVFGFDSFSVEDFDKFSAHNLIGISTWEAYTRIRKKFKTIFLSEFWDKCYFRSAINYVRKNKCSALHRHTAHSAASSALLSFSADEKIRKSAPASQKYVEFSSDFFGIYWFSKNVLDYFQYHDSFFAPNILWCKFCE